MKRHILLAIMLLVSVFSFAQSDLVHNQNSYVDDYANVIDPASAQSIDAKIKAFKAKSTAEISVVTVNSLNDKDIADFTRELGIKWGVGGKSNNGLMILVSPKDHKWRIEVGPGLQGDLPDITTSNVANDILPTHFRANEYGKGLDELVAKFINIMDPEQKALQAAEERKQQIIAAKQMQEFKQAMWIVLIIAASIVFIVLMVYRVRLARQKAEEEKQAAKERYEYLVNDLKNKASRLVGKSQYDSVATGMLVTLNQFIPPQEFKTSKEYFAKITEINSVITHAFDDQLDACIKNISTQQSCKTTIDGIQASINKISEDERQMSSRYKSAFTSYPDLFPKSFKYTLDITAKTVSDDLTKFHKQLSDAFAGQDSSQYKIITSSIASALSLFSAALSNHSSTVSAVLNQVSHVQSFDASYLARFKQYENMMNQPYITDRARQSYASSAPLIESNLKKLWGGGLGWAEKIALVALIMGLFDSATSLYTTDKQRYDNEQEAIRRKEQQRLQAIQDEKDRIQREADNARRKKQQEEDDEEESSRRSSSYSSSSSSSSSYSSDSGSSSFGGGSMDGGGSSGSW